MIMDNITNSQNTAIHPELHCQRGALVGSFGIFIQGILGAVAFSTLLLKRWREPKSERRSWRIWFYDTSKQGFGAMFIHFANVFLADAVTAEDPCTWYLISFLLDSTIGLFIIYTGLKITQCIVHRYKCTSLYFGEYGYPPRCNAWLGQCALYLIVMLTEKVLVGLMVLPSFWSEVRHVLLVWIKNPQVEVVLVMLIVPFCVNAFMFWVVDNFLMRKRSSKLLDGSSDSLSKKYKRNIGERRDTRNATDNDAQYFKFKSRDVSDTRSSSENRDSADEEVLLLHRYPSNGNAANKNVSFSSDDEHT